MDMYENVFGGAEELPTSFVNTNGEQQCGADRRSLDDRRGVMNAWRYVVTVERRSGSSRRDRTGSRAAA